MTNQTELEVLQKSGITIECIRYGNSSEVFLSQKFLQQFDVSSWPTLFKNVWDYDGPGINRSIFSYNGKRVGLSHWSDNNSISVELYHPMTKYWLSILQPIWDEQNIGKCRTCNGTGWDGIGYIFTCVDCGGTGKK